MFNILVFFLNTLHLNQYCILVFKCSRHHKQNILAIDKIRLPNIQVEYYSILCDHKKKCINLNVKKDKSIIKK